MLGKLDIKRHSPSHSLFVFHDQARDDAFANEVEIQDADDKDEEPESPYKAVQIELAVSETKPYTRLVLINKAIHRYKNILLSFCGGGGGGRGG